MNKHFTHTTFCESCNVMYPSIAANSTNLFAAFLLHGCARCLIHKLTPYSEKRRELHKDIFNQLQKVGAMCGHFTTSDVILFKR